MDGQPTRAGLVAYAPAEWRAFGAFVRRPVLPAKATGPRAAALRATLWLFALDLLLMALVVVPLALIERFGPDMPENVLKGIDLGPLWLAVIVVAAPLIEELLFRGWLSGRPGHVTAIVALVAGIALTVLSGPTAYPILALGSIGIATLLAVGLAFWLRGRPPFPYFSRHFAWFYGLSTLLFALVHLTNYTGGNAAYVLPLVIPQLAAGLVLGYARVSYGLWSSMLLHMMHNGLFVGLVLATKGA